MLFLTPDWFSLKNRMNFRYGEHFWKRKSSYFNLSDTSRVSQKPWTSFKICWGINSKTAKPEFFLNILWWALPWPTSNIFSTSEPSPLLAFPWATFNFSRTYYLTSARSNLCCCRKARFSLLFSGHHYFSRFYQYQSAFLSDCHLGMVV